MSLVNKIAALIYVSVFLNLLSTVDANASWRKTLAQNVQHKVESGQLSSTEGTKTLALVAPQELTNRSLIESVKRDGKQKQFLLLTSSLGMDLSSQFFPKHIQDFLTVLSNSNCAGMRKKLNDFARGVGASNELKKIFTDLKLNKIGQNQKLSVWLEGMYDALFGQGSQYKDAKDQQLVLRVCINTVRSLERLHHLNPHVFKILGGRSLADGVYSQAKEQRRGFEFNLVPVLRKIFGDIMCDQINMTPAIIHRVLDNQEHYEAAIKAESLKVRTISYQSKFGVTKKVAEQIATGVTNQGFELLAALNAYVKVPSVSGLRGGAPVSIQGDVSKRLMGRYKLAAAIKAATLSVRIAQFKSLGFEAKKAEALAKKMVTQGSTHRVVLQANVKPVTYYGAHDMTQKVIDLMLDANNPKKYDAACQQAEKDYYTQYCKKYALPEGVDSVVYFLMQKGKKATTIKEALRAILPTQLNQEVQFEGVPIVQSTVDRMLSQNKTYADAIKEVKTETFVKKYHGVGVPKKIAEAVVEGYLSDVNKKEKKPFKHFWEAAFKNQHYAVYKTQDLSEKLAAEIVRGLPLKEAITAAKVAFEKEWFTSKNLGLTIKQIRLAAENTVKDSMHSRSVGLESTLPLLKRDNKDLRGEVATEMLQNSRPYAAARKIVLKSFWSENLKSKNYGLTKKQTENLADAYVENGEQNLAIHLAKVLEPIVRKGRDLTQQVAQEMIQKNVNKDAATRTVFINDISAEIIDTKPQLKSIAQTLAQKLYEGIDLREAFKAYIAADKRYGKVLEREKRDKIFAAVFNQNMGVDEAFLKFGSGILHKVKTKYAGLDDVDAKAIAQIVQGAMAKGRSIEEAFTKSNQAIEDYFIKKYKSQFKWPDHLYPFHTQLMAGKTVEAALEFSAAEQCSKILASVLGGEKRDEDSRKYLKTKIREEEYAEFYAFYKAQEFYKNPKLRDCFQAKQVRDLFKDFLREKKGVAQGEEETFLNWISGSYYYHHRTGSDKTSNLSSWYEAVKVHQAAEARKAKEAKEKAEAAKRAKAAQKKREEEEIKFRAVSVSIVGGSKRQGWYVINPIQVATKKLMNFNQKNADYTYDYIYFHPFKIFKGGKRLSITFKSGQNLKVIATPSSKTRFIEPESGISEAFRNRYRHTVITFTGVYTKEQLRRPLSRDEKIDGIKYTYTMHGQSVTKSREDIEKLFNQLPHCSRFTAMEYHLKFDGNRQQMYQTETVFKEVWDSKAGVMKEQRVEKFVYEDTRDGVKRKIPLFDLDKIKTAEIKMYERTKYGGRYIAVHNVGRTEVLD